MKAIVYTEFGPPDVLHLEEVAKPTPTADEVLVEVQATSVKYGDLSARNFGQISPREFHMPFLFWLVARASFGIRRPKKPILGSEFAGEIAAVGDDVTSLKPGDQVFGYLGQRMGAYAEYVCVPEDGMLARKPAEMSDEEAATVPYGALMALNLLGKANIEPGQHVLVNGASGAIGSAAVQLAKAHFGAEVTGVCSTPRMEYVRSLGADRVIDYTREDFSESGETYDLVFDVLGKRSFSRSRRALKPDGTHLYVSFKLKQLAQMLWTSIGGGKQVVCALSLETPDDLVRITELIQEGKIKSHVDARFPLERVAEAHRYVEAGRSEGNVAITIEH